MTKTKCTLLGCQYDAVNADYCQMFADHSKAQARILELESALNDLLPGLILDRRYADADDDIDALNSRIETVQEALYPKVTSAQREADGN